MFRAITLALPIAAMSLSGPTMAQTTEAQVIAPQTQLSRSAPELYSVFAAFGLYDVLEIMSVEGIQSASDMEAEMFPGRGGAAWPAVVAGVYATDRLIRDFEAEIDAADFSSATLEALRGFVTSDLGQRIVAGEVAARRAFLDPEIEETANAIVADAVAAEDPRLDLLQEFIRVNDLIERNVSGALNGNFAFFRGLQDGNGFEVEMPEDLMLAEIWGQTPEVRSATVEWLLAYQMTAYTDLSDADLRAYTEFSGSAAGQAFNAALFRAFDVMFERVSYDLGRAAAVFIAGEDT